MAITLHNVLAILQIEKNKRGQEKIKDNNEIPTKESQHIVKTQYNVITNL